MDAGGGEFGKLGQSDQTAGNADVRRCHADRRRSKLQHKAARFQARVAKVQLKAEGVLVDFLKESHSQAAADSLRAADDPFGQRIELLPDLFGGIGVASAYIGVP